jgi:hypothetical protein
MSGKLPSIFVHVVPPSVVTQTCATPKFENVATILLSDEPTFTQRTNPIGKPAPEILVAVGAAVFASSTLTTLPVTFVGTPLIVITPFDPRNNLFGV